DPAFIALAQDNSSLSLIDADFNASALIIYTSGTTGKPKGAVSTHCVIDSQASVLVKAWYWTSQDRIHHILPLHHIHGIVNALICALYAGATVEMHQKFDTTQVWSRWTNPELPRLSIFMSVPTVYAKLQQYFKAQDKEKQTELTKACKQFRFMVSGSASLPTSLRNDWRKLSGGQVLLERYGMTEIGMALSQEYVIWERVQGTVGMPLPGVQVRIISSETNEDVTEQRQVPGMLQIKGPTVFKEYWQRPEATKKEFTEDGWFITGDVAQRIGHRGYYQIMGGEKVSALEIERELLSANLGIQDVAVVGVPDPEWGQKVAAVVVLEQGKCLSISRPKNNYAFALASVSDSPAAACYFECGAQIVTQSINRGDMAQLTLFDSEAQDLISSGFLQVGQTYLLNHLGMNDADGGNGLGCMEIVAENNIHHYPLSHKICSQANVAICGFYGDVSMTSTTNSIITERPRQTSTRSVSSTVVTPRVTPSVVPSVVPSQQQFTLNGQHYYIVNKTGNTLSEAIAACKDVKAKLSDITTSNHKQIAAELLTLRGRDRLIIGSWNGDNYKLSGNECLIINNGIYPGTCAEASAVLCKA
ncbi:hypothetical protein CU098_001033, partial [Rhizopus stolonifer]